MWEKLKLNQARKVEPGQRTLTARDTAKYPARPTPPEPIVPSDRLVSVVMPTYNQEQYIREAVDSILAQTHRHFELVIVNDGSTDGTAKYLATLTDPRVRIISKPNGGTGTALNAGYEVTKGEYETWWASDNVMYPDCLAALVSHLERVPDTDMVYSTCDIARYEGQVRQWIKPIASDIGDQTWTPGRTLQGHYYFGICWMWRRAIRLKAGGTWQTLTCEDYDMTIRMEQAGARLKFIGNNLGMQRYHKDTMSAKLRREGRGGAVIKEILDNAWAREEAAGRKAGKTVKRPINILFVCVEFDPAGVGWGLRCAINRLSPHTAKHVCFNTTFAAPETDLQFKSIDELRPLLDWADVLHFQSHIWSHRPGNKCFDFLPVNEYGGPSPFEPWLKTKRVFFHMHCGRYQQDPGYWVKECARVGARIILCDPLCPVPGGRYLPNIVSVPDGARVNPKAPFAVSVYGTETDTRRNNVQIFGVLDWLKMPRKGFGNVPREQAFRERANYAVCLDNLTQGFVGMWTWEGLRMGAACVSRVSPKAEAAYRHVYGQAPPIINVQNIDEMAQALRRLRDSAAMRAEYAEQGRAFARECMTDEKILDRYIALYLDTAKK